MTIIYTLTPTTLVNYPQADGEVDVVYRVIASYIGTDGEYTAACFITTEVTYTQDEPFTPYNELTQEQVADWVLDAWTPEQTTEYQAQLDQSINNQKNPTTQVLPLPWIILEN